MKIDNTENLQPLQRPSAAEPRKGTSQEDFAKVLDQKMAEGKALSQGPAPTMPPLNTAAVQQVAGAGIVGKTNEMIANELIDGLERYQRMLTDRTATLRDLSSELMQLKRQSGDVQPALDRMAGTDPMKGILRETILIIRQETERFNQGMYVDG